MRLQYEYTTRVTFQPGIARHNILLRCLPAREPFVRVHEETLLLPDEFWRVEQTDGFGNRIVSGGTEDYHSSLDYVSRGVVEMSTYCIPDVCPHPMYGGRGARPAGAFLDTVLAIMHEVHATLEYVPGVTDVNTTLDEVLRLRKGVCQDFAHLMIDRCRRAGYPARYVCGLMMGEGATHAWVEVHDGKCWYAFDPTNDTAIASGYIKLAHGRSATDCPVGRGTYIGKTLQTTVVSVRVSLLAAEGGCTCGMMILP